MPPDAPNVVPLRRADVAPETLAFRRVLAETGLFTGDVFDLVPICRRTAVVTCPLCDHGPGVPCTATPRARGWHVARFGAACRQGRITGPELTAVLYAVGVFRPSTIVMDGGA